MNIIRRVTLAALLMGTLGTVAAAAPAQAAPVINCIVAGIKTDATMVNPTVQNTFRVAYTRYKLPNGQWVTVNRTTDPMTAAYAAARAIEVRVCYYTQTI